MLAFIPYLYELWYKKCKKLFVREEAHDEGWNVWMKNTYTAHDVKAKHVSQIQED